MSNFNLVILLFVFGIISSWVSSRLTFPKNISKMISTFLLLSIGLKGGYQVILANDLLSFVPVLVIGVASCFLIPILLYYLFKSKLGIANSAAIGASFGSVSAITFITAQSMLEMESIDSSGTMVAVMAIMEVPAILISIYLYKKNTESKDFSFLQILKSIVLSKSILAIVGGFIVGMSFGSKFGDGVWNANAILFKIFLSVFLFDLGLSAQKNLNACWTHKYVAVLLAVFLPLLFGTLALLTALQLPIAQGDQILIAVLVGSASYLAAPAVVKVSIQEASPSLYIALPLALTFPMNILFGIPFYIWLSQSFI